MDTEADNQELVERLKLIENMIAEGRCKQENWGWMFVVWGVAYYVAFFWSWLGKFDYAWPVTMLATAVLTGVLSRRKRGRRTTTTLSRAIGSIWTATGLSMFVVLCAMGYSGRSSHGHAAMAAFAGMLGLANAACSITLRWKTQFFCALFWWATAVAACYASDAVLLMVFLAAVFIGQIVFGGAMMIAEMRRSKADGAVHA